MSAPGTPSADVCRICGGHAEPLGVRHGKYSGRDYRVARCVECRYAFVVDPWTDFAAIYDDSYYAGRGADPLVDYEFELQSPGMTIRNYEWRGLTRIAQAMLGDLAGRRWLDFGAGNGGLVRYVTQHSAATIEGYENGSIAHRAQAMGIAVHPTLQELSGDYDIVTAVEVFEHVLDPVAELRQIRDLMRVGGLLLITTGNAAPFADRLTKWSYLIPEIHISFYEPETLARAMREAGFEPQPMSDGGGFDEVLKYKVLKNLRLRRRSRLIDLIPARPLALAADRGRKLRAHPVGRAI